MEVSLPYQEDNSIPPNHEPRPAYGRSHNSRLVRPLSLASLLTNIFININSINAGVAALHLEDQVATKRCGHLANKELVDTETFTSRIRAAALIRSQLQRDIVIIARTDALAAHGLQEALARLKAAIGAGADVAFLEGVRSVAEAKEFTSWCKALGVPALYNCVPGGVSPVFNVKDAREVGYGLVITPTLALGAVYEAVEKVFRGLKEEGDTKGGVEVGVRGLFESCGLEEVVEFDVKAGGKGYEKGI